MRALPSPSQEATVRRIALEEGVNPDVLVSIWEQESSKSVDPALTGPVLPQGHKYAGAYGQGPFQIMSFHGEMPNDFEAQARWAARHLKQKGVRGYYGKTAGGGSATPTGMPGFPSTDSYEQQVMARVPGAGMLAQAGTPDVPQGLLSQAQSISPPVRQQEENMDTQGSGGGLLSNPWLLIGASILANNDSKNTGKVLGKGLLGGTAAWQAMKQQQLIEQQRQMQIEMARRKQIEDAQNEQMRMEFLRRIQGSGGQPGAGMAPQDLARIGMEGAVMGVPGAGAVMQYGLGTLPYGAMTQAQQAETQDREMRRAMELQRMQYEGQIPGAAGTPVSAVSPKQQQEIAAEGQKAEAKKRAEARVDLPKAEATAAQTLKTIDDLMAHPGRTWATGSFVGRLPALPGDAYDFKTKLEMAKGQVFLRAYETLKGGGQITQIEGEKAEKAMAALDRAQSEEAFLQGLKDLRDAVAAGQRKLRESAGLQGGMEEAPMGGVDFRFENGRLVPAR